MTATAEIAVVVPVLVWDPSEAITPVAIIFLASDLVRTIDETVVSSIWTSRCLVDGGDGVCWSRDGKDACDCARYEQDGSVLRSMHVSSDDMPVR